MFNDSPDAKWNREFAQLGAGRVRDMVLSAAWDREKKQAARRWLEKQDVLAWQSARGPVPADRKSLKERIRSSRVWIYVIGGIFLLMGLGRILNRW